MFLKEVDYNACAFIELVQTSVVGVIVPIKHELELIQKTVRSYY